MLPLLLLEIEMTLLLVLAMVVIFSSQLCLQGFI
jgi:hypothetical protein